MTYIQRLALWWFRRRVAHAKKHGTNDIMMQESLEEPESYACTEYCKPCCACGYDGDEETECPEPA